MHLNDKLVFGRWFVAVTVVVAPVVLWLTTPWKSQLPLISIIAECFAYPMFASVAVYAVGAFVVALTTTRSGRGDFVAFAVAAIYADGATVLLERWFG